MKIVLWIAVIVVVLALLWAAFGLWTGLYSIYTIPPSKDKPDGATLLVTREAGEPMFNSPDYVPPPKKPVEHQGMGFSTIEMPKRPLHRRTIIELPYIEWAYKKSLESAPKK